MSDYCGTDGSRAVAEAPEASGVLAATEAPGAKEVPEAKEVGEASAEADGPRVTFAECVLCQEPTEYPESYKGITLCPVCEWQEAQRSACSG